MLFLEVPYAEKEGAKSLGARWNPTRKRWYVPDGVAVEPFAQWLPKDGGARPQGRVDAYAAKLVVGANYIERTHDCNPFEPCAACEAALAGTSWADARRVLEEMKARPART